MIDHSERQTCTKCGKEKSLDAFGPSDSGRRHSWCRACKRHLAAAYRESPGYGEARAAYAARPEVRERALERYRRDRERRLARTRAWRRTALGRLSAQRPNHLYRLRRATDPDRVARLEALIAAVDREVARIRQSLAEGVPA